MSMTDADLHWLKRVLDRIDRMIWVNKLKFYVRHPLKALVSLFNYLNPFKEKKSLDEIWEEKVLAAAHWPNAMANTARLKETLQMRKPIAMSGSFDQQTLEQAIDIIRQDNLESVLGALALGDEVEIELTDKDVIQVSHEDLVAHLNEPTTELKPIEIQPSKHERLKTLFALLVEHRLIDDPDRQFNVIMACSDEEFDVYEKNMIMAVNKKLAAYENQPHYRTPLSKVNKVQSLVKLMKQHNLLDNKDIEERYVELMSLDDFTFDAYEKNMMAEIKYKNNRK